MTSFAIQSKTGGRRNEKGNVVVRAVYKNDTLTGTEYFFKENGDTLKYFNFYHGYQSMPYKKLLSNGNVLQRVFLDSAQSATIWTLLKSIGKIIKKQIRHPKKKCLSPRKISAGLSFARHMHPTPHHLAILIPGNILLSNPATGSLFEFAAVRVTCKSPGDHPTGRISSAITPLEKNY